MNGTICHKEKDLQKSVTSTLRDEVLTGDNALVVIGTNSVAIGCGCGSSYNNNTGVKWKEKQD